MYLEIPGWNIRILGSLHSFPPKYPHLPRWVSEAYDWAEVIAIEHDRQAATQIILAAIEARAPWALFLGKVAAGAETVEGVEDQLARKLQQDQRPTFAAIESVAFLDRLAAVPIGDIQRADEELERLRPQRQIMLERMYEAWATGLIENVESEVKVTTLFTTPSLRHAMLSARNQEWAATVASIGPRSIPMLLVVGCMHLVGNDCVQNQLKWLGIETAKIA